MRAKQRKLARNQLEFTTKKLAHLKLLSPPSKGWIRAIRDTIGMTGKQLAGHLNVTHQRVTRMEQDEVLGKVTLNTMRSAAQAMDCVFVYGIVPIDSLEHIVRKQATIVANNRMKRSDHLMRLESQELNETEKARALENLIDEIVETMPKTLWDTPHED